MLNPSRSFFSTSSADATVMDKSTPAASASLHDRTATLLTGSPPGAPGASFSESRRHERSLYRVAQKSVKIETRRLLHLIRVVA
jgi:hypothetical protein